LGKKFDKNFKISIPENIIIIIIIIIVIIINMGKKKKKKLGHDASFVPFG
jgi:hypothetical protein